MIIVYELTGQNYHPAVAIDEAEGTVKGDSDLADYFRDCFESLRNDGYDPVNHMDGIKNRLYNNYRNGYYWAV
jgi:hypothetical protein